MPDSSQTVRSLKEDGYKLGLVSNTMFSGAMHVADMRKYDLDSFFDTMVFSADVNKWKPDPAPFQHVLEILGVPPSRAVFVGDDPGADVVGGQRAGLFTIHYPSSQRFSSPDGFRPDATISGLNELPGLVRRLNGYAGHDTLPSL
jgi:putative hydrolase of the HAD superfamily